MSRNVTDLAQARAARIALGERHLADLRAKLGTPPPATAPNPAAAWTPENVSWWAGLEPIERKFLCHAAQVAPALAAKDWADLAASERGRIANAATLTAEHFSDKRRALL